jgi:hypothetical protein
MLDDGQFDSEVLGDMFEPMKRQVRRAQEKENEDEECLEIGEIGFNCGGWPLEEEDELSVMVLEKESKNMKFGDMIFTSCRQETQVCVVANAKLLSTAAMQVQK